MRVNDLGKTQIIFMLKKLPIFILHMKQLTKHIVCNHQVETGRLCHITVVEGKRRHAPCKIFSLQQILFLCHFNFDKIITLRRIRLPSSSVDITGLKTVVSI